MAKKRSCYELLGIGHRFSEKELDQAFQRAKQKARYDPAVNIEDIEKAYQILRNPRTRKQYDEQRRRAKAAKNIMKDRRSSKGKSTEGNGRSNYRIYIIAMIFFLVVLAVFVLPRYHVYFRSYSVGDDVYDSTTGLYFGTILDEDENHEFNNGLRAHAYRVETENGDMMWIPAVELKARFEQQ